MAETRPGGIYKTAAGWVDANGNPAKAPTRAETAEQRQGDQEPLAQEAEAPSVPRRRA